MVNFAVNKALLSSYLQADFFGKCIFLSLFALSVVCWVVLVLKTMQAKRAKLHAMAFQKMLSKHEERILSISLPENKNMDSFAEIFRSLRQKTLEILNKNQFFSEEKQQVYLSRSDLEIVESHVLTIISSETKKLQKNLFILSTIQTLAPFLGLLGTVWGILITFSQLQSGANITSNSAILGGLSTALSTTVLGLIIAIPAVIFSNYLKNAFRYLSSDMEDFLYKLLSTVELQYRKPQ